jgi:hypothetical protein
MALGANLPSTRFLADMLCAEFDQLQEEFVLVLDDYGVIHHLHLGALPGFAAGIDCGHCFVGCLHDLPRQFPRSFSAGVGGRDR